MNHAPHEDGVRHLARLLTDLPIGMLTTIDEHGHLHSRPMATQQTDFDGDLWFFSHRSSHKSDEIRARPQVNVSYGSANGTWLSISGSAELSDDMAKKRELWRPMLLTWFPKGVDDPDLSLLRVRVERAEYWEKAGSIARTIGGFLAAVTTGHRADQGEHEVIDFERR